MSLGRFVYYCAVVGGWMAFLAWMLAEGLFLHGESDVGIAQNFVTFALVGAALGGGLNLVAGLANPQWKRQLHRFLLGLDVRRRRRHCRKPAGKPPLQPAGTLAGRGLDGPGPGHRRHRRNRGKSVRKCRNGALGGTLGGLLGGLLFNLLASGSGMAARATAFVVLGVAIGALVGLTQLVLKEAWLTVVDGFRPGRELILGQNVTLLGRGNHLPLPLLGYPGRDLDAEHARIIRRPDGQFILEDNRSRLGTRLNGQPVETATPLKNGDLIKLGTNIIRFNSRQWGSLRSAAAMRGRARPVAAAAVAAVAAIATAAIAVVAAIAAVAEGRDSAGDCRHCRRRRPRPRRRPIGPRRRHRRCCLGVRCLRRRRRVHDRRCRRFRRRLRRHLCRTTRDDSADP